MTFNWLPDSERDPHPRLTWFAECCFDLTVLALFRKEEMLPEDYRLEPGTLVISNHQRDSDVPILTTVLCQRKGVRLRWPLPFFASREDFFRRGFLAEHLPGWPRPVRALLGTISLAWFFRIVRAEPMRRVPEFTLDEALAELPMRGVGDRDEWLNARGRREAAARKAALRKAGRRSTGGVHTAFWGLRRLRGEAHTALGPEFRATVAAQLARFGELLDAGRCVYFAPEGTISRDGRLGRIRAGAWLLSRLAASPPPILPIALSYDPLGPGRLRVIVRVGRSMRVYHTEHRVRFDSLLRREIRTLYPVNASHLISRFLTAGPDTFTARDFTHWLQWTVSAITASGLTLDPLLTRTDYGTLAAQRLAWLVRKGLVVRDGERWRTRLPRDASPGWRRPAALVRYFDNALDDLTRALAPGLAAELKP